MCNAQMERSELIDQLGLNARDLRLLENRASKQVDGDAEMLVTNLTTSAKSKISLNAPICQQVFCMLVRERCIFIHLAYIRCIVTSSCILMVPPDDDRSATFLLKFKERVKQPLEAHFLRQVRFY